MAALFSDGSVMHSHYWCSSTAEISLGFVGELAKTVAKPLVIVIDNASIHRARAIQPALKMLWKKGITLKFLPPYSPVAEPHREAVVADEAPLHGSRASHQSGAGAGC